MTNTKHQHLLKNCHIGEYPLLDLHYIEASGVAILRRTTEQVEIFLLKQNIERVQLPFLIPHEVLTAFQCPVRNCVKWVDVCDGRKKRVQGVLPVKGGALNALPLLSCWIQSYRQLPRGVFNVDFAVSPFEMPDKSEFGWEDVHCINGFDIRPRGTPPRMVELIGACLRSLGWPVQPIRSRWWFNEPAWMFHTEDGELLAVVQSFENANFLDGKIIYVDMVNQRCSVLGELFYISELALLNAPVQNREIRGIK